MAKVDLEPCKTGHWWIQDGAMHVYCEYCPAAGRVVLDDVQPHVEVGRPTFIEPKGAS